MKGLELSRAYWEKCALPLFRRELPAFWNAPLSALSEKAPNALVLMMKSPRP